MRSDLGSSHSINPVTTYGFRHLEERLKMKSRREDPRFTIRENALVRYSGRSGWILNVSRKGMSILYANPSRWPDNLVLDLVLPEQDVAIVGLRCRKMWECGIDSIGFLGNEVLRRRGLGFVEPDSAKVTRLMETLDISPDGRIGR